MNALQQGRSDSMASWLSRIPAARAVYDVVVSAVRESAAPAAAERARRAPLEVWHRVLDLEGCAAWLDRARQRSPALATSLGAATPLVRSEGARALRNAVAMVQQLAEVVPIAAGLGVRMLVLKGSARLLAGETAGARTMADIDLLVADEGDGRALHDALESQLGYQPDEPGVPTRHLPSLVRPDSLPIEIHRRLADDGSSLGALIWTNTRSVPLGGGAIEIPSATATFLHALEHAVLVHRANRYRLRDVLDLGLLWTEDVDAGLVANFAQRRSEHRAVSTLLAAARRPPASGSSDDDARAARRAWRRIRRVGRARLWAPPQAGVPAGSDPRVLVLSQLAEGLGGPVWGLFRRGVRAPGRAVRLVTGDWLPVEAERARAAAAGSGKALGS